jgi:hypothetical protein
VNRLRILLLGVVAAGAVHAAPAQAPAARGALQLLRDSLALARDTLPLLALERHTIDVARHDRDDPLVHLRLGFIALRLNDLAGGSQHADDAAGEFEWASDLRPDWPYPWYGIGLAEWQLPDRATAFAGGLWTMLGLDRDSRVGNAFLRAVRADPSFVEGVVGFAQVAREQASGAQLAEALHVVRLVTASPLGWDPALLLERGRLERLVGDPDSARVAFRRALLLGRDEPMAWLELARTIPLTADTISRRIDRETPVEEAYYTGAASEAPYMEAEYRHDIAPILSDSELAVFDQLHGSARVEWLRSFWQRTAAGDLRTPAARLAEHFRRWNYALRHFRLPPYRRSFQWGIEVYQSGNTELDDRGLVWLRQGAPTFRIVWPRSQPRRVSTGAASLVHPADVARTEELLGLDSDSLARTIAVMPPQFGTLGPMFDPHPDPDEGSYGNETWRYRRPDGDLVLHFIAREDPHDYRLVASALQLDVSFDALVQAEQLLPGLAGLLTGGAIVREHSFNQDLIKGREAINEATSTTSWTRNYGIVLGGRVQWLTAGEQNGVPLVHIVYAVDASLLHALPVLARSGRIPLAVRAAMLDSGGAPVATLDTVQRVPRPGANSQLIAMHAEMEAPPGRHEIRFGVEADPSVGAVYPLDSMVVPDIHSDTLALSSLLIGVPHRSLAWEVAAGDTVWLDATNHYTAHDTLAVYFEAYGTRPDARYTVRFAVRRVGQGLFARLFGHHGDAITLSERVLGGQNPPGESIDSVPAAGLTETVVRRALDLGGLAPGKYALEVSMSGGGQEVVRRRGLVVY